MEISATKPNASKSWRCGEFCDLLIDAVPPGCTICLCVSSFNFTTKTIQRIQGERSIEVRLAGIAPQFIHAHSEWNFSTNFVKKKKKKEEKEEVFDVVCPFCHSVLLMYVCCLCRSPVAICKKKLFLKKKRNKIQTVSLYPESFFDFSSNLDVSAQIIHAIIRKNRKNAKF